MFKYDKEGLERLIFLLMDLNIIQDFHIKGYNLVGLTINHVHYGDMTYTVR